MEASFGACEEYDLDYDGNYYPDGIEICVLPNTKTNEYYFGVCWLNKCTGENDVQTWFGADPSSWNIKGKEKNMNEKYGLTPYETREILFYKTDNGDVRVEILLYQENLWLTQAKMAELFEVQKAAISKHLKNIFESGELLEESVVSKMETTAADGKRYNTNYYNLDAIIAVGYRVNSRKATMFRIWANRVLKEFIIKGYVMDDARLREPENFFGKDYFEEQLERIRDIRSSERRFYQRKSRAAVRRSSECRKAAWRPLMFGFVGVTNSEASFFFAFAY